MRIAFLLLLLGSVCPRALADLVIRGETTTVYKGGPGPFGSGTNNSVVTIWLSETHSRIDFEVKGVVDKPPMDMMNQSTIHDLQSGDVYRIVHRKKEKDRQYMVVTKEQQQELAEDAAKRIRKQGPLPSKRPLLRATGRKELINGFDAEEFVAVSECCRFEYWFAKVHEKYWQRLAQISEPAGAVYGLRFPDPALFPGLFVRTVLTQDLHGVKSVTTMNTVSVEEKPIEKEKFMPPPGYRRVDKLFGVM